MYSGKGKGSVDSNLCVDGSDFLKDMMMGLSGSLGSSSSSSSPFDHSLNQAVSRGGVFPVHLSSSVSFNGYNEQNLQGLVERDLSDVLCNMNLGVGAGDERFLGLNDCVRRFEYPLMNRTVASNLMNYNGSEALSSSPSYRYSYGNREVFNVVDDSLGPFQSAAQKERMDRSFELSKLQKRGSFGGESDFRPVLGDSFVAPSPRFHGDDDNDFSSRYLSSQLMKLGQGSSSSSSSSAYEQWPRGVLPNGIVNQSFMPMSVNREPLGFKQNLLPLDEGLICYSDVDLNMLKNQRMNEAFVPSLRELSEVGLRPGASHFKGPYGDGLEVPGINPMIMQPVNDSMIDVQNYICQIAKNQLGCRILQRAFDEGTTEDVQIIFDGIIDRVVEFMVDQFGNYLVQKLLTVCNDHQRMQIVLRVTREPGLLVRISLDPHGTRVVQKLIETVMTKQQISLVTQALEPGFLDLATDLNGNHVLQRCLLSLTKEHNKFIINAAARYCLEIATHRYGCCLLNKCIGYASGKQRDKLLACVISHAHVLAQDAFGNYVIQHVIELKNNAAGSMLVSQFDGHFVHLSKQKFSSHVVEKCLKFIEVSRSKIIRELISAPQFEQLLQDPFANYVIQSALEVTKGSLRALLVEALRPYQSVLRSNPFCKRILSRNVLKKK